MTPLTIGRYRTLRDLDQISQRFSGRIAELRRLAKVVVIDNEDIELIDTLRANSYNLTYMRDIQAIEIVRDYQIVLCDIYDVGITLNPGLHGAHVIKEIKRSFPYKPVVAYSSGVQQQREMYSIAVRAADNFIHKDAPVDEWMLLLDSLIEDVSDPSKIWQRTRLVLLKNGLSLFELTKAEDQFVRKILNNPGDPQSAIASAAKAIHANELIGKILTDVAVSLLVGAVLS